jgi:hypothetical protein
MGPQAMTNDPLESCRSEIGEYDSLLACLGSCAQTIQVAIEMLANAPDPMSESLRKNFPKGSDQSGELVARLIEATSLFSARSQAGQRHIQGMIEQIQEARQVNASLREEFVERDKNWETNQHYEGKVQSIREQASRKGSVSQKMAEKMSRNQQKQQSAEQAFHATMAKTAKDASEVLEAKWSNVGQVLGKLCRYYVSVFDGTLPLTYRWSVQMACNVYFEEFTANCSQDQEWVMKAQALGQKAKDRMTGFAGSAREKFESAKGSLGSPLWGVSSGGGSGSSTSAGGGEGNPFSPEPGHRSDGGHPFSPELGHRDDATSSGAGNYGGFLRAPRAASITSSFSSGRSATSTGDDDGTPDDIRGASFGSPSQTQDFRPTGLSPKEPTWPAAPGGTGGYQQQTASWPSPSGGFGAGASMPSPWEQSMGSAQNSAAPAGDPWGGPAQVRARDPWS